MNSEERYIYEERLAILGAINRLPTPKEKKLAMKDVEEYRKRLDKKP